MQTEDPGNIQVMLILLVMKNVEPVGVMEAFTEMSGELGSTGSAAGREPL